MILRHKCRRWPSDSLRRECIDRTCPNPGPSILVVDEGALRNLIRSLAWAGFGAACEARGRARGIADRHTLMRRSRDPKEIDQ
jgi:hypothetical protein